MPLSGPDDLADNDDDNEDDPGQVLIDADGLKVTYHERGHRYYMNGKRSKGVSTVSKIASDDYNIRLWHERMVALGLTVEPEGANLRENIAMHSENKDQLADLCEAAKKVAGAHFKADRGSQKHRVLELVLTGQEDRLITRQQRSDAEILKRTMDRYRLTPRADLVEQFVAYPNDWVFANVIDDLPPDSGSYLHICGRFDAVLAFERADGTVVLVDLKSGENAIKYPHSTMAQLAMYNNAPFISVGEHRGDRIDLTQWSSMPEKLDHEIAYVLLVENEEKVGSLHKLDIVHGWRSAKLAMQLLAWRNAYSKGLAAVAPVEDRFTAAAKATVDIAVLRQVWAEAKRAYSLTPELQALILGKVEMLTPKPESA